LFAQGLHLQTSLLSKGQVFRISLLGQLYWFLSSAAAVPNARLHLTRYQRRKAVIRYYYKDCSPFAATGAAQQENPCHTVHEL
jgi:hypothetical protein